MLQRMEKVWDVLFKGMGAPVESRGVSVEPLAEKALLVPQEKEGAGETFGGKFEVEVAEGVDEAVLVLDAVELADVLFVRPLLR